MKSAEDIAIEVVGKHRWKLMGTETRQEILKIARAYAAQYESNMPSNYGKDEGNVSMFSHWKDDRDQEDLRNSHEGDEPMIGHFRD
jgi:hypothetical protein